MVWNGNKLDRTCYGPESNMKPSCNKCNTNFHDDTSKEDILTIVELFSNFFLSMHTTRFVLADTQN